MEVRACLSELSSGSKSLPGGGGPPSTQSGLKSPTSLGLSPPPLLLWPLPALWHCLYSDHTCFLAVLPAQEVCSFLRCLILICCLFPLPRIFFQKLSTWHVPSPPLVFTDHTLLVNPSLIILFKISISTPTPSMVFPIPSLLYIFPQQLSLSYFISFVYLFMYHLHPSSPRM